MVVSRGKTPSAQETFMQMAGAAGLRGRIFVTLGLLILVRLGIYLPVPGIDRAVFQQQFQGNQVLGFLDYFSGGDSLPWVFLPSVFCPLLMPQLFCSYSPLPCPSLERLQKDEGEAGRRKLSQITRYVALGWAIIQSVGFALLVNSTPGVVTNPGILFITEMVFSLDGWVYVRDVGWGTDHGAGGRQWCLSFNFSEYCLRSTPALLVKPLNWPSQGSVLVE